MKNILVAVDRREDARHLINHTVKIAKLTNAKIWIIHVTDADPEHFIAREAGPQYVFEERAEKRKEASAAIKKWAEEVEKEHSIKAEGLLIEGSITKAIKSLVEDREIDLVVAGHKKKNLIYSLFTANKKKDLVDVLKIPLLAVPLA